MKCPKCNSEINGNKKFCTQCGYNLENFIKEEKAKKKAERGEKFYKIKLKIFIVLILIFALLLIILAGLNFFGKQSHKSKEKYSIVENEVEEDSGITYTKSDLEIELTDENRQLDYDNDGLTNEQEAEYETSMINSDTDGDGLTDYEEVTRYNSDLTKYSTADDGISDYIKVKRNLKIDRKYTVSEVKPEEVNTSYNIKLIPDDLESQYYGGVEEYDRDKNVNSTYSVFDFTNFKGKVEYTTNSEDSILLIREGKHYTEFKNYKNENGKLIITITADDNYKDFVITTKENYENYKNK